MKRFFSEQWPKKLRSSATTKPISLLQQQEDADFLHPERSSFPSKNRLLRHSKFQALSWMALRVSQQTFGFAVDGFDMTFSQKKTEMSAYTWDMNDHIILLLICLIHECQTCSLPNGNNQKKHLRFDAVSLNQSWGSHPPLVHSLSYGENEEDWWNSWLGGGFKHFLFSPLLGEMIQFD